MEHVSDMHSIVARIEAFVTRRNGRLSVSPSALHHQLLQYIHLRQNLHPFEIEFKRTCPKESKESKTWTTHSERVWSDWISYTFTNEDWDREVMSYFGTDVRAWEARLGDWRSEVFAFLNQWIQRSQEIVDAFDPTSIDESENDAPRSKIDPYLLEHGKPKQRRSQQPDAY